MDQTIFNHGMFTPPLFEVRAWIEDEKHFIYSKKEDGLPSYLSTFFYALEQIQERSEHPIPIMLYSRAKDPAGIKIYETDVVQTNDGKYYLVYFEDGYFSLQRPIEKGTDKQPLFKMAHKVKVIGNPWEDPHSWEKVI